MGSAKPSNSEAAALAPRLRWKRGVRRPPCPHPLLAAAALAGTLGLLVGCDTGTECGAGTHQVGDTCIGDAEGGGGGTPAPMTPADAGPADPGPGDPGPPPGGGGSGDADAGSGFSTTPPGGGGGPAPPGCDEATGECDEWEAAISAGVAARQAAAGCTRTLVEDARVDGVAERHARHQADIDAIDPTSPDGNLFDQVTDAGVRFRDVAALFSVTRDGAEEVLDRWAANPDTAVILGRCDELVGVGVASSATEASYVTVILARE